MYLTSFSSSNLTEGFFLYFTCMILCFFLSNLLFNVIIIRHPFNFSTDIHLIFIFITSSSNPSYFHWVIQYVIWSCLYFSSILRIPTIFFLWWTFFHPCKCCLSKCFIMSQLLCWPPINLVTTSCVCVSFEFSNTTRLNS